MRVALNILLAVGFAISFTEGLTAQAPSGPIRVSLILPNGRSQIQTEVVRRQNRNPRDVVLLGDSATARDLAAALNLMSALRARFGDRLSQDIRAAVDSYILPADWEGSPYHVWLEAQLARLRSAPERSVRDIGTARVVHITLPAPTGRFTAKKKK